MNLSHRFTQFSHQLLIRSDVLPSSFQTHQSRNPFLKLQVNPLPNFHLMMLPDAYQGTRVACSPLGSRHKVTSSYQGMQYQGFFSDMGSSKTLRVPEGYPWAELQYVNKMVSDAFSLLVAALPQFCPFLQELDLSLAHHQCQMIMISGATQEELRVRR